MDEINYKIDSSNSIISSEAIHLLIKNIMKIVDENKNSANLDEYYQLLKSKCGCSDPLVSSTACQGLLNLIKFGYIELDTAFTLTLSIILTAKTYTGITSVLSNVLEMIVLNEIKEKSSYTCKWNISGPPHPFIIILKLHPNSIHDVYNELAYLCSRNSSIYQQCIECLRPVFIWILCHPIESYSMLDYRQLFQLILSMDDLPDQTNLLLECLGWQQMSSVRCLYTYEIFAIIAEWAIERKSKKLILGLLPVITNVAHSLSIYCKNPKPCFALIKKMILYIQSCNLNYDKISSVFNCIACMLGDTISRSPVAHLGDLVQISKELRKMLTCPISISVLISAFLHWNYNKNVLTLDFNEEIRNLVEELNKFDHNLYEWETIKFKNEIFDYFKSVNRRIYVADELCQNYKDIVTDKRAYLKWKEYWNRSTNKYLKCEHILYLQGLLVLNNQIPNVYYDKIDVLNMITEIITEKEDLMIGQLPITLYCLKSSKKPVETVSLLKMFPTLANLRENIPIVIGILKCVESNDLSKDVNFIKDSICAFVIKLYMLLVKKQTRCYPYLHTILAKSINENISKSWELLIAQASAMQQICEGSDVNPTEVVPIISEIIRQSTSEASATACCLCLDAIGTLWKKDIIDPQNSWQVLSPKFSGEEREAVKISICKLLGSVSEMQTPSDNEDFVNNIIQRLWKYTENHSNEAVCIAAFKALSNFKLESMTLKQIPDIYKIGIKLPPNLNKLLLDTNPKPEDVLNYIPRIVWGNMFKFTNVKILSGVTILCHSLMEREVIAYRSGIYNTNVAEPETAKYLPSASVVGGVMEYFRKELYLMTCKKNLPDNIIECLKCLSMPRSKPLPPLNWSFLYEILKDEQLKKDVKITLLQLLMHQTLTSPSAMKMVLEYLEYEQIEIKDKEIIFELLPEICKSVKSKKLLLIVGEYFDTAYYLMQTKGKDFEIDLKSYNTKMFSSSFKYIGECLKDEKVNDSIKVALGNIVIKHFNDIDYESDIWTAYAKLCSEFPDYVLERIVDPISKKSCYVRCILALKNDSENSLDWLNKIIEVSIESLIGNDCFPPTYYLLDVSSVLAKVDVENSTTREWFMKLMTNIQIDTIGNVQKIVEYLCDMLITFTIVLARQEIFGFSDDLIFAEKLKVFPQVMNSYFEDEENVKLMTVGCQIINWIIIHKNNCFVPVEVSKAFNLALICCRNVKDEELWSRYVSARSAIVFHTTL